MSSATASEHRVAVAVSDHVATVTLTRADKHNALDVPMFEQINAAADRVAAEPGVRAVVLCGEGPSFCSGLDVVSIMAAGNGLGGLVQRVRGEVPNWFQRVAYAWLELPMPVIAAVHGSCFGGGLQIALGADIRIAAPAATLSVMESRWGLVPARGATRRYAEASLADAASSLALEDQIQRTLLGSPNQLAAVMAGATKQPA